MSGILLLAAALAVSNQSGANPLFEELVKQGVSTSAERRLQLPLPTLADGVDSAGEQAVLAKIVGDRYPVDEFVRDSVVTPFVLRFPDIGGPAASARGVDVWFIVYGDLNDLSKDDVLKEFTTARGRETTLHVLTGAELQSRNLPAASGDTGKMLMKPGESAERFVHTTAPILEKVELRQTLRCVLSRAEESIVIATIVDHRFDRDQEFPNLYQRLIRNENGETTKGPVQPYAGAGGYLKATRLAKPAGAILVEYHAIYSEPRDWFNGANLLQSKLPILLQSRIRELRRDLRK